MGKVQDGPVPTKLPAAAYHAALLVSMSGGATTTRHHWWYKYHWLRNTALADFIGCNCSSLCLENQLRLIIPNTVADQALFSEEN